MPKEITHWKIIEAWLAGRSGPAAAGAVRRNIHCALWGAVFPDTPYYAPARGRPDGFRRMAARWHGSGGEDTHALPNRIIAAINQSKRKREPLLAFLIGYGSHLAADRAFHPFVYYFSGSYENPDRRKRSRAAARHRDLESVLDLLFCGGCGALRGYSLKRIMAGLEIETGVILDACGLVRSASGRSRIGEEFAAALRVQRMTQSMGKSQAASLLKPWILKFGPAPARELFASFYAKSDLRKVPRVAGAADYRHPWTGETRRASPDDLFAEAVEATEHFASVLEASLRTGHPLPALDPGASLAHGLIQAPACRFFSPRPLYHF